MSYAFLSHIDITDQYTLIPVFSLVNNTSVQ